MGDWVSTETKPRMSQLALWSYRIATWPLIVGAVALAATFLSEMVDDSSRGFSDALFCAIVQPAWVVLLVHSFSLAPLALILGVSALVQIRRRSDELCGGEYAKVAVIIGLVVSAYIVAGMAQGLVVR